MKFSLKPIVEIDEKVVYGPSGRQDIDIEFEDIEECYFLGRGAESNIGERRVSREHCVFYLAPDETLTVRAFNRPVWINDYILLRGMSKRLCDGDVIALHKECYCAVQCSHHKCYSYRVTLRRPASQRRAILEYCSNVPSAVLHELRCPVCQGFYVLPTTLVPCGHSFCLNCVSRSDQCPLCRQNVDTRVRSFCINGIVSGIVESNQGTLDTIDVAEYKKDNPDEPTISSSHLYDCP
jgi:hypothetical protein